MSIKKWRVIPHDGPAAAKFAENLGIPVLLAILLQARGITDPETVNEFLSPKEPFSDPCLIPNMQKAAERVTAALDGFEKIAVYGDYDADGVTATAMLYSYLESCGGNVIYYIPNREGEGYGINRKAVDKLKEQGVQLIVTVDNGISSVDEVSYAAGLGIETVITDHHRPREVLPPAFAVVDPYISGSGGKCPFCDFAGVGVAFKLIMAMEGEDCDIDALLDNYADLAAIGTVGDIVPLNGENRAFVKAGLQMMPRTDRVGLKALLEEAGLDDRRLTARNVSFGIVPRINAAGRIGLPERAVRLLISESPEEAGELAAEICHDNEYRRGIEDEIYQNVIEQFKNKPELLYDRVLIAAGDGWHHGVIGIVASRVTEMFGKPCVIFSCSADEARGSGRSVEGFSLFDAVCSCKDLLTKFGGHPMAAGMSMPAENVEAFRKKINSYAASLDAPMPAPILSMDCLLKPEKLSVEIPAYVECLEPFGTGNPYPLFGLVNMAITNIEPVGGGKHLRVSVKRDNCTVRCMMFRTTLEEFEYRVGDIVDLAVVLEAKEYNGKNTLSVIIREIKFSGVKTGELIEGQALYEKFRRGEHLTAGEAARMLPDRNEFAAVYRFLSAQSEFSGAVQTLLHRISGVTLKLEKLLVILDILEERGLIGIKKSAYTYNIKIIPQSGKVNLSDSVFLLPLKKFEKAGET